jgi:hypothetical protein
LKARPGKAGFRVSRSLLLGDFPPLFDQLHQHLAAVSQAMAFLKLVKKGDLLIRQRDEELVQPRLRETAPIGAVFIADGILGQGRKIAEESMKTAQPVRLNCRHTFAGAAPLGRDLVIEKGKARICEPQQPQTQEAGDLDGAMLARMYGRVSRKPQKWPAHSLKRRGPSANSPASTPFA